MTSHGSEDGLLLRQDYDNRKTLSPGRLDRILDAECGARLTVVVVSACHAGVFIGRASKGDNRIWLTAALGQRGALSEPSLRHPLAAACERA